MLENLRNAIETSRIQRNSPEQVGPAVHSMDALGLLLGRGDGAMVNRMKAHPLGRKLLEERHDILALVSDRDHLRTLPEGSLGREYCRFAEDNQLFPECLAEQVRNARVASGGFVPESTPEVAYLHDRYRDLHDLWHVLTGYGTDMAGEFSIIAFQTRQVGYRSMALMAFMNVLRNSLRGRPDLLKMWFLGRRRGARAQYLLAEDWERLLPMPLEVVRRELNIEEAGPYRPWNYPDHAKRADAAVAS
jgi:ubiquinone biosynthesis protein COQ4